MRLKRVEDQRPKTKMIIGICGGTGSGKTTIARKIVQDVGAENVVLVEQDSYYRNLADAGKLPKSSVP